VDVVPLGAVVDVVPSGAVVDVVPLGAVVDVVAPGEAAPVSVGSAAGELLVVDEGVVSLPPPPSHAPRIVARLSNRARPRIFVFITPLSPIAARLILAC
jgi:hypothetical protein